jgi:hypothetical protein
MPITTIESFVGKSIGRKLEQTEVGLLKALQHVHDKYPVKEWPMCLKRAAAEDHLEFNFTEADWKECVA